MLRIDIVIELIGGIEPARSYILAAINAGKHVVTANKDLIAVHGKELLDAAEAHHVDFLFEAAVACGIPISSIERMSCRQPYGRSYGYCKRYYKLYSYEDDAGWNGIQRCTCTCNRAGICGGCPTADIEGLDAGRKVAILASVAFNSRVVFDDVYIEGITKITAKDIKYAKEMGCDNKTSWSCKEYRRRELKHMFAQC